MQVKAKARAVVVQDLLLNDTNMVWMIYTVIIFESHQEIHSECFLITIYFADIGPDSGGDWVGPYYA